MKNKKSVYALIIVLIFLIYIVFSNLSFIRKDKIKTQVIPNTSPQVQNRIETSLPVTPPSQPSLVRIGVNPLSEKNIIQVTLNVLDKTYKANIKEGATLYDAMSNIQSVKENNFDFKYKEYPSLGIFIDEINGIKESPGKYWLYYVNNKEASVGVSKYILKSGDIISWKQE